MKFEKKRRFKCGFISLLFHPKIQFVIKDVISYVQNVIWLLDFRSANYTLMVFKTNHMTLILAKVYGIMQCN